MAKWEASWELEMPSESAEDHLLALVVRDLLDGSSYDLADGDETAIEVAFEVGEELIDGTLRLLVRAEVDGVEDEDLLQHLAEQVLEDVVDEGERLAEQRVELGELALERLAFRPVEAELERWTLVVPEWLAPDQAEVPFGFRPFLVESGEPWPGDALLDAHARVVLVAHEGVARLYGVPAPAECADDSGGTEPGAGG